MKNDDSSVDVGASLLRDGSQLFLRLERRYAFPVRQVWTSIAVSEHMNTWWTPITVDLDLVPGGTVTYVGPDEELNRGTVLEVEEPDVLASTWGQDTLRWRLRAGGDGCVLQLTITVPDPESAPASAAGWHSGLDMLDDALAGGHVGHGDEVAPPTELIEHYRRLLSRGGSD